MDVGTADPNEGLDEATEHAREEEAGQGNSPFLTLDGFTGPLERLLSLARAQRVDLAHLSLTALVDQLATALQHAPTTTPLGQKGEWIVMAAWLVQLRSLLLLPAEAPARQAAEVEADQLRARLIELRAMQALAGWLQQRPQLGHDVFARGRPEDFGTAFKTAPSPDVIAFLWASLALFDDDPSPDTVDVYRPQSFAPYAVAEARERILRVLTEAPDGGPLAHFLPEPQAVSESIAQQALRRRSGWASTFVASLELAKQGDVVLAQAEASAPIHVRPVCIRHPDRVSERESRLC